MKKKFGLFLVLAGFTACALFALTGCDFGGENEKDTVDNSNVVALNGYVEDGDMHYETCEGCGERKYSEHDFTNGTCVCGKDAPHDGTGNQYGNHGEHKHAWSEDCTEDGGMHYQTCNGCEQKAYCDHNYENGECVCGKEQNCETNSPAAHQHAWSGNRNGNCDGQNQTNANGQGHHGNHGHGNANCG